MFPSVIIVLWGTGVHVVVKIKSKVKQYHAVGTILKSNIKIVESGKIDTPNTNTRPRTSQALL